MSGLRLAQLLAALSLTNDLGMGFPPEHSMRNCLLALRVGESLGLDAGALSEVYYTALLFDIGCTASAHEFGNFVGGDDIRMRGLSAMTDFSNPRAAMHFTGQIGAGLALPRRVALMTRAMRTGQRTGRYLTRGTCEVATRLASRMGMGPEVVRCLDQIYERWDGEGDPRGLQHEEISPAARIVAATNFVIATKEALGNDAALLAVENLSGSAMDPEVVGTLSRVGGEALRQIDTSDPLQDVVASEPGSEKVIRDDQVRDIALAFADLVDIKTPFTAGHSRGVANLAVGASGRLGLSPEPIELAALFHDLGRVGVPNRIWEKAGALTTSEWESVRLHAYHTERILARSGALADIASIAGMHHERTDGSGYHRGIATLAADAALLAAADAFHAMTEARPHRGALDAERAAEELRACVREGLFDPEVAEAIVEASGQESKPASRSWPAGLTAREVEVLRLVAAGKATKEIGRALGISPKTADNHIQSIYGKIEVGTRASATLFAVENGLLGT